MRVGMTFAFIVLSVSLATQAAGQGCGLEAKDCARHLLTQQKRVGWLPAGKKKAGS
jgi:hypothetical protein